MVSTDTSTIKIVPSWKLQSLC